MKWIINIWGVYNNWDKYEKKKEVENKQYITACTQPLRQSWKKKEVETKQYITACTQPLRQSWKKNEVENK